MENLYRHGDVLLTRVDNLPKGKEIPHEGEYILAYGEVTGHAHRLTVEQKDGMKILQSNGIFYISLTIPAPLTHEEHKTIEVQPGIYRIGQEREYDYCSMEMRRIAD